MGASWVPVMLFLVQRSRPVYFPSGYVQEVADHKHMHMRAVCKGRASASGRTLTDAETTAHAAAPAPNDRQSWPASPALGLASSANSTAASAESATVFTSGVTAFPPCDYDCDQYSRHPVGTDLTNGQYFDACGSTSTCGSNQLGTQYACCPQTCRNDSDCPASYYCPGGPSANSYCMRCPTCSTFTSAKCQVDQQCKYPCCLTAAGESCYSQNAADSTTTKTYSAVTCCPSSSSSYMFDTQTNSCNCGTPQSCPGSPSPSPPSPSGPPSPSPPPAVSDQISTAAMVPVVTAVQRLAGFSVATFDAAAQSASLSTLEANIKRVSEPAKVSIPKGGITDGSVLVQTSVVFLNGEDECAKAHKSALTGSSASSVYGSYNAVVDPHTFHTDSTANPEQGSSADVHQKLGAFAALSMALAIVFCS